MISQNGMLQLCLEAISFNYFDRHSKIVGKTQMIFHILLRRFKSACSRGEGRWEGNLSQRRFNVRQGVARVAAACWPVRRPQSDIISTTKSSSVDD